ncbi:MAG TPA: hypothetical protein VL500_00550 [Candidatus Eisenbacteria bacterium]|nr:hypothetical protein [Candidatus Eisenbacteria bacterium]
MIALLIVLCIIGLFWAIPSPQPAPKPEPKTTVVDNRTVHVHVHLYQRVEVRIQALIVPPPAEEIPLRFPKGTARLLTAKALERYQAPLQLPAPRGKTMA